MGKIVLNDMECEIPSSWQDQGMVTLTIPSTDKNVRPNVICTKEQLAEAVDLQTYFAKIKEAVKARGIQNFQILDEREIKIAGLPAMQMVCVWDLEAIKQMMGENQEGIQNIQPGQKVQQIQVSFIKDQTAVNLTASFPADQFDLYARPFQKFLATIKFN